MKKILSLILVVILLLSGLSTGVSATEVNNENVLRLGEWEYFDTNIDPAREGSKYYSWSYGDYKEGLIPKTGAAPFGAKNGEAYNKGEFVSKTTLQQYIEGSGKNIPAYFFVNKFQASNFDKKDLKFTIHYDDAAIIYINGKEVWLGNTNNNYNSNLDYGAISANGTPNVEEVVIPFDKLSGVLKDGENYIGVELHQSDESSSDIYFDLKDLSLVVGKLPDQNELRYPIMTIGATALDRNFTWYSGSMEQGYLEYTKSNDTEFKNAKVVNGKTNTTNNTVKYSNTQVALNGLEANTEYIYRFWNGNNEKSDVYTFRTQGNKDYSFLLAGDPQIGSGGIESDIIGWENTLSKMKEVNSNASFILSVGDQVNQYNGDEGEYAGFIERADLKGMTLATVVGNHDAKSASYSEHFSIPNVQKEGSTAAGSNYYFVNNNTLFIDINSSNRSIAEHRATIEKAKESTKDMDIKWTVLTFHHSIYSVASHAEDTDILQRREQIAPLVKEFGIDVVLMGHDHVYVRSHIMDGLTPIEEYDENKNVPSKYVNPKGALYLTANSASGSKYYSIMDKKFPYSAVQNQEKTPNFTNIEVTDTTFKATTYRSTDKSIVDEVTLVKESAEKPVTPQPDNTPDSNANERDLVNAFVPSINSGVKSSDNKIEIIDIDGHWAENTIREIVAKGIMEVKDKKFNPNSDTTRFETIKALAKAENVNPKDYEGDSLKDITSGSEESGYINWAIKNKIIAGYPDGRFGINDMITREQMARVLNQYVINLNKKFQEKEEIKFNDEKEISEWALNDVKMATKRGLLYGKANKIFDGSSNLSRSEVAQIIKNIIK